MLSSKFFRRLYFITVTIVAVVFGFIPNANSQVAAGQEEAENMQLVGFNSRKSQRVAKSGFAGETLSAGHGAKRQVAGEVA